jgi:tetratricopeptide (TPR) repeat protein
LAEDQQGSPPPIAKLPPHPTEPGGRRPLELLARLAAVPHAERVRQVEADLSFHSPDFCRLLLAESRQANFLDSTLAVDWASLAVRVADFLSPKRAARAHRDLCALRAEALAVLGNAYRVIGELRAAEESFLSVEPLLAAPGVATAGLLAEVHGLRASLRLAQRRLPEAREEIRSALALAADLGDRHQLGKLLLKEAKILEEEGDLVVAASRLADAAEAIDCRTEPELYRIARFNLLGVLLRQGRYEEAAGLLETVAPLFADEPAESTHRLRLRWSEGLIARSLHRLDEAEEALLAVENEFIRRQMGYDAALVAIDLGIVYLETGAVKPLRRLAAELLGVLAAKDLSKEAFACVLLYQDACQSARLTSRLARELARFMREDRHRPPSLKVAFRAGEGLLDTM